MKKYIVVETMRSPDLDDQNQTPASLLLSAEELFALGYSRNAATDCRSAILASLWDLCVAYQAYPHHPQTGKPMMKQRSRKVRRLLGALHFIGKISVEESKPILAAVRIGNRASHGRGVSGSEALFTIEVAKSTAERANRLTENQKVPIITPRKAKLAEVSEELTR